MTMAVLTWLVAIPLLGVVTGMRTMTAMMVLCWFAYRGHLPVGETWAAWTSHLASAIIFTVLAIGEYIGDKLPQSPDRTAPGPLAARVVFGGLVGAIVATSLDGSLTEGILLGIGGALLGAYGGLLVRRELSKQFACHDWKVAIGEDLLAIGCAILALGVITG